MRSARGPRWRGSFATFERAPRLLPPATEAVWNVLGKSRALAGFTLVRGTALALRIRHRISEDLDFAWASGRLPRRRILVAMEEVETAGLTYERADDPGAVEEFVDSGLDLHDYQQDFLVSGSSGGTKVSFFDAHAGLVRVLVESAEDVPRVATVREIFATKALVSAQRSRTRDWFDLYVLMRDHGFTLRDYVAAFERAKQPLGLDIGINRLCSGHPDRADEQFQMIEGAPPSVEEMRDFFVGRRDAWERESAKERFE